ncbi:uncharacterized protein LOC106050460 [Biomphalaria glabrata]|uniref:Uncharacterized protein LOC106050460 n=1 Tax=Biomphalaria glabrata TaxID=6526 RepID=A0A9U8DU00_BIOGL|nr:uncharacterized protein LOC106050460 [Biomphalaria glabrata]XP_013060886.2 uncharacterized protein LOC106050460 [Biomphalaria glabrata]XP_055896495.1 uncharacterized protein LOC106050460 [Biomphalaria glabrata]XP_055896496.1 uncharacterized protein LOC106050460 [Biomphalaria glabrata]KAI8738657.1 kelch protein 8 [Biomphalaria glabrata]
MNSCETLRLESICLGLVQSIEKFWKRHENEDFQVNIEGETIRCHSFILASSSEFFGGLLRSNMKEKLDMKVDLQNIPLNIFQLILKTLYTGCELLTKDNVLEVWSAVHQLQIDFLIQHCEDFVLKNISLETLEEYKKQAEFLMSKKVSQEIFSHMLENFMTLRNTNTFLRLQFEDLLKLIESDNLVVTSEDLVLQSVYEWINFGEISAPKITCDNAISTTDAIDNSSKIDTSGKNIETIKVPAGNVAELTEATEESKLKDFSDNILTHTTAMSYVSQKDGFLSLATQCQGNPRDIYLLPLLKATRYFLLSEKSITNLYQTKLVQSHVHTIGFLFESLAYKTRININGYLPIAAVHRECSPFENMGIFCHSTKLLFAFSFAKQKMYYFPVSAMLNICQLTVLNNQLFASVNYESSSEIFVLQSVNWVSVCKLEEQVRFCLSHDDSIISITMPNALVYRYKPISPITKIDVDVGAIDYAIGFYQNILLFTTSDLKTKVRCWDTDKNTLSDLTELDFSANSMTSFTDDRSTYILDSLGNLYQVNQTETIQFTFIDRIWSSKVEVLRGAVLLGKVLFLNGTFPDVIEKRNLPKTVKDIFSTRCNLISGPLDCTSNFISFAISKTDVTDLGRL